ncbi:MAG: hypothetical protein FRX49_10710 [Trebouxia sp. A1-2]|nr:MAG: hypothetical protein FRX49_10710 [Trebouxia sp. A1-2]
MPSHQTIASALLLYSALGSSNVWFLRDSLPGKHLLEQLLGQLQAQEQQCKKLVLRPSREAQAQALLWLQ